MSGIETAERNLSGPSDKKGKFDGSFEMRRRQTYAADSTSQRTKKICDDHFTKDSDCARNFTMQVLAPDLTRPIPTVAEYLGTLAFGRPDEHDQRDRVVKKITARRIAFESGRKGDSPSSRIGSRFFQKLDQRQRAAALALPYVGRDAGLDVPNLANGEPSTWNAMEREGQELGWHSDPSDLRTRIWRSSLSTLHLGLGLRLVQAEQLHDRLPFDCSSLFSNPQLIQRAFGFAQILEQVVLRLWGKQIASDTFWHLEPSKMPPD